jgi:hypothetical protein
MCHRHVHALVGGGEKLAQLGEGRAVVVLRILVRDGAKADGRCEVLGDRRLVQRIARRRRFRHARQG